MDDRELTAIHEAAHACVGTVLGRTVAKVEVFAGGGGLCSWAAGSGWGYAAAVSAAAGGLAARRADPDGYGHGPSRGDLENVAGALPAELAVLRCSAENHARHLVNREWRKIELVAAELCRRGVLTGEDVTVLMGGV